jgi:hypothetical protein
MKAKTFENIVNHERVVCEDVREITIIDGVDYLLVHRLNNFRPFLMRKESLKEIKVDKVK